MDTPESATSSTFTPILKAMWPSMEKMANPAKKLVKQFPIATIKVSLKKKPTVKYYQLEYKFSNHHWPICKLKPTFSFKCVYNCNAGIALNSNQRGTRVKGRLSGMFKASHYESCCCKRPFGVAEGITCNVCNIDQWVSELQIRVLLEATPRTKKYLSARCALATYIQVTIK